jgi:hypothetical protein
MNKYSRNKVIRYSISIMNIFSTSLKKLNCKLARGEQEIHPGVNS